MGYSLKLFGVPRVVRAGVLYDVPLDKPASMLFYLAQRADWVSRSELAFLYHPDVPEEVALGNVRVFVYRAKKHAWTEALEVEKFRLRFRVETDTHAFLESCQQGDWEKALRLYQGSFLTGLQIADTPAYETWLELERQSLAQKWREAVLAYSQQLERSRDFQSAAGWLEQLLNADPLDEVALQSYLSVLYGAGKRKQAGDVFERFCLRLKTELDAEPLEATRTLLESLRHAQQPVPQQHTAHNLPAPSSRFVGRARELMQLDTLLQTPDCRLVTLVGLGGAGKTRLGLEVAHHQLEHYPNGVWFVPLVGVQAPELLVSSIAAALPFEFAATGDPKEQLLNFLRAKTLLIVLDNFEHLVAGAGLLEELLSAAPGLRLLVTSRTALELSGEWLIDVEGLSYPPLVTGEPLDSFDAVKLFIHRAERLSNTFVPTGQTLLAIAELTRKVEGLPLALELAAAWTRSLSVPALLKELAINLDILASQWRDLPERHRSLRLVFDYSWQRLSPKEQEALAKLSIFRGGFTLEAAEQVAGVHLALLLNLINHTLLRQNEGRYHLHELIRQYVKEQLEAMPQQTSSLAKRHAIYYADWLTQLQVHNQYHRYTLNAITEDIANIRVAWSSIIKTKDVKQAQKVVTKMFTYFDSLALYQEGLDFFEHAVKAFPAIDQVLGPVIARQGALAVRMGKFTEAQALLEQSLKLTRGTKADTEVVFSLINLANTFRALGDLSVAEDKLSEAFALAKAMDDHQNIAAILNNLAFHAFVKGQVSEVQELFGQSLALYRKLGNQEGIARVLRNLGNFTLDQTRSRTLINESLVISRSLGDQHGIMMSLLNLGKKNFVSGDYLEAKSCFEEGLSICRNIGDRHGIALSLNLLSEAETALKNYQKAIRLEEESLAIRQQINDAMGIGYSLDHLGLIAYELENYPLAKELIEEALSLRRASNEQKLIAISLCHLACIHTQLGAFGLAKENLKESFQISQKYQDRALSLEIFLALASLFIAQDKIAAALELLVNIPTFEAEYSVKVKAEEKLAVLARNHVNTPFLYKNYSEFESQAQILLTVDED